MQMKAIIYTSCTGSTAEYAALLSDITSLPVFSLEEAKKNLPDGAEIIYLGWVMAGGIKGFTKAAKRYCVRAVCAVGMCRTGEQTDYIRTRNSLPENIPLFTLQGNFDAKKLRGINKLLIDIVVKAITKKLSEKTERTDAENDMLDLMLHGGKRVSCENLREVSEWYETVRA